MTTSLSICKLSIATTFLLLTAATVHAAAPTIEARAKEIPADFPTFTVPGEDASMAALRDLFWHHYDPTPKATLWDEWLLSAVIWPASGADKARASWRRALSDRGMDSEGYVFTNQHHSIAHQTGWPFPFWNQGTKAFGWHFSFDNSPGEVWRPNWTAKTEEWQTTGVESIGIEKEGWVVRTTASNATMSPPAFAGNSFESPYVQLRWRAEELETTSTPYIEWATESAPGFSENRRMYFAPSVGKQINYTMIPVYRHPEWKGTVTGLRVGFDNVSTSTTITIQGLFAQYDTRHNVNNPSYVIACIDYFLWTRDLNFLRENIEKIRLAMRYMETEFGTDKNGIVTTMWVGHEGRTGVTRNADGSAVRHGGEGVGNNYWDLLPFGQQDSYATIRHYGAALKMGQLEKSIANNPGWNIPASPLVQSADYWTSQAAAAKENGNRLFWNDTTGRFTLGIDAEGNQADYGFTFLNLEAIHYGFATPDHAQKIMDWISGKRSVSTDTSQTSDIYHWTFAPRATTLRNISHYMWVWSGAETIPFGGQVQDGGAVLGFSYHDLMSRLKVLGPDDAAKRLEEITAWYEDAIEEGGYRAYYDGKKREGTLQGGGTAGGLGLDQEFFESVLVPQIVLDGFVGFKPTDAGFSLQPKLPSTWPSLTVTNVSFRALDLEIQVTKKSVVIKATSSGKEKVTEIPYSSDDELLSVSWEQIRPE